MISTTTTKSRRRTRRSRKKSKKTTPLSTFSEPSASSSVLRAVSRFGLDSFIQNTVQPDHNYLQSCANDVDKLVKYLQNNAPPILRPSEVIKVSPFDGVYTDSYSTYFGTITVCCKGIFALWIILSYYHQYFKYLPLVLIQIGTSSDKGKSRQKGS